jgi:putative ABC transport system ATP-binding protein
VTAVTKRVRDGNERRTVVHEASFELARGSFALLRGPSGSGKTTLLALVGAMLSPTSGEVHLDGEPTSRMRDGHRAEVRRRKVGFVFQDLQLVETMSAHENVLLPKIPDGIARADELRADALLARFGVEHVARSKARALSGGERQRVALARALFFDPPLLLLDEPTAHVDDARVRTILDVLAAIADEGRAVLAATHDARLVQHPRVDRIFDLVAGTLTEADRGDVSTA